mgnify:CR=1 FL=1
MESPSGIHWYAKLCLNLIWSFCNNINDMYIHHNTWETERFESQGIQPYPRKAKVSWDLFQSDFASSCSLRLACTSSLMVFISAARSFKVLAICSSPCMNSPPCWYDLADTPETPETPETPDTGALFVLWIPKRVAEAAKQKEHESIKNEQHARCKKFQFCCACTTRLLIQTYQSWMLLQKSWWPTTTRR